MPINPSNAIQAYDQMLRQGGTAGMEARDKPQTSGFSDALQEVAGNLVETMREGDRQSLKAIAGTANIDDVAVAVANAEVALQTVITVRDKVVRAYEDIMRMPI